jgi:hypothetical protein
MYAPFKNSLGSSLNDVVLVQGEWTFGGEPIGTKIMYAGGKPKYTYNQAIMAYAQLNGYNLIPDVEDDESASTQTARQPAPAPPTARQPAPAPPAPQTGRRRSREASSSSGDGRRVRARPSPIDPADMVICDQPDQVYNKDNVLPNPNQTDMNPATSSMYHTASSEDEEQHDEMVASVQYAALIDELKHVLADGMRLLSWLRDSSLGQLRRYVVDIKRHQERGTSSNDANTFNAALEFLEMNVHRMTTEAATVSGDQAKIKHLLDAFLNTPVSTGDNDPFPNNSYAERQPLKILRQKSFEELDAVINKRIMVVTSMMQTYKTAAQALFMLLEMARGNMVCMLQGADKVALDQYEQGIKGIVGLLEKECRLEYTVHFAKPDDMADAIARHKAGHPVVVIGLVHDVQMSRIADGINADNYWGKVAVIVDEAHSIMSPSKGSDDHSKRCSLLKTMIKSAARMYLVSATSADVIFNLDGLVPADDILRKTGPDRDWIGLPMYIGMDALQPIVRTDAPFYMEHFTKDTLYGLDVNQVIVNLTTNLDMLNRVDSTTWSPVWTAFIESAVKLPGGGFVFTRQTSHRNVLMNTELICLSHLKAHDCVTVMIHGSSPGNAKANDQYDLVIEPSDKSAYSCIVMWRDPDSIFWSGDDAISACTTRDEWRSAVKYKCYDNWTGACDDADFQELVEDRMIFMTTNLDGGSVSIVQKSLGRGITHVAIAQMSDSQSVIQMIGRPFHNQSDVKTMILPHGAEGTTEEDRERYVYGKPIVYFFGSVGDLRSIRHYYQLPGELHANMVVAGAVTGTGTMYTRGPSAVLRGTEIGLGVAKMTQRVVAHAAKLDAPACTAQAAWGTRRPEHIEPAAMEEQQQQQQQQQEAAQWEQQNGGASVRLVIGGDVRRPDAVLQETDMDVVFRFDNVDGRLMGDGEYEWLLPQFPVSNTTKFGTGNGNHQANNCPAHLAYKDALKNFYVVHEERSCVEIRVLKVDRERAAAMDAGDEAFTWTKYESRRRAWEQQTHVPGGACGSDACTRRREAQDIDGADMDSITALLRRFCSDPQNVGKHGTIATFNTMLAEAYPAAVERIIRNRRDNGVLRPDCMVYGTSMCSVQGVQEEVVNGQREWRIVGRV